MKTYLFERLFRQRGPLAGSMLILLLLGCHSNTSEIDRLAKAIYQNSEIGSPLPERPFKSDGCSWWPDDDWLECCVQHDLMYWKGGSSQERKMADLRFKDCLSQKDHHVIGTIMYFGVRIGGVSWLPTPFRWGFGWKYPQSRPPDASTK